MTSRNERRGFLEDIAEHREEDGPRLIFADWLEEHGDESERAWAQFMRIECAMAGVSEGGAEWNRLEKRTKALLAAHGAAWFGPAADDSIVRAITTRRGFVEIIELPTNQFTAHAAAIFEWCPLIEEVFLTHTGQWK